jgi:hypothetical protein
MRDLAEDGTASGERMAEPPSFLFDGLRIRRNQVVPPLSIGTDTYAARLCHRRPFTTFPSIVVARAIYGQAVSELNGLQAS